ncbi:MAG: SDR family oxidoreductase [Verrucomicrobia bacterium]|nr:SDR family oxidoreductase [Verrucomicrobiota bacterium]
MDGHGRTALITGGSTGIGLAFAHEFAAHGFDIVLVARREELLREAAEQLCGRHHIRAEYITADLARRESPERIIDEVIRRGYVVDALVNNAGYGVPGDLRRQPWQRHADFIEVLVTAVVHLTYLVEPGMVERGYGRILNVASLAGLTPATAGHTLYAAAKAFVIRFSESLALEHVDDGVHVTAVCPGFTRSEFHDVVGNRELMNGLPRVLWMGAEAVAREGYTALMQGRSKVVTGLVNRALATGMSVLPTKLSQRLMRGPARKFRIRSPR